MIAAIVPAAGRSERMGRPKLILPIGGLSVIAHVTIALRTGGADPVLVIVPPASVAGAPALAAEAARGGLRRGRRAAAAGHEVLGRAWARSPGANGDTPSRDVPARTR